MNKYTHTNANANSLAAARQSHTPGRDRMPVHSAGTVSRARKANETGLGTCRRTFFKVLKVLGCSIPSVARVLLRA